MGYFQISISPAKTRLETPSETLLLKGSFDGDTSFGSQISGACCDRPQLQYLAEFLRFLAIACTFFTSGFFPLIQFIGRTRFCLLVPVSESSATITREYSREHFANI